MGILAITRLIHFIPLISFDTAWKHRKRWFSNVFRGYGKRSVAWNGLIIYNVFFKSFCQDGYSNYDFENRLNFRIHAALNNLEDELLANAKLQKPAMVDGLWIGSTVRVIFVSIYVHSSQSITCQTFCFDVFIVNFKLVWKGFALKLMLFKYIIYYCRDGCQTKKR